MSRDLYYVMDQSVVAAATCICEFLELRCGAWSHQSGTGTLCVTGKPLAGMWLERALAWSHGTKSAWVKFWVIQTIRNTLFWGGFIWPTFLERIMLCTCVSWRNSVGVSLIFSTDVIVRFLPTSSLVYVHNSVFAFVHLQKISQPLCYYLCVCFTWFISSSHLFESCLIAILNVSSQCQSYIAAS